MKSPKEKIVERIANATDKLAKMKARQLLKEMRDEHVERTRARHEYFQQRIALGDVIVQCGLGNWTPQELRGMVLHVLDESGSSPTVRLGFRKRAEQADANARGPPKTTKD